MEDWGDDPMLSKETLETDVDLDVDVEVELEMEAGLELSECVDAREALNGHVMPDPGMLLFLFMNISSRFLALSALLNSM